MGTLIFSLGCSIFFGCILFGCLGLKFWIKKRSKNLRNYIKKSTDLFTVGFFHPYCNAGGGGERVLWMAIKSLQKRYPNVRCLVYTGDVGATSSEIISRAHQRFNIELEQPVEFVFLKQRKWVEASTYAGFTLLAQSLGSLVLGFEALLQYVPDVYVDSMGYAFTLPLFKYLGGCCIACYVHYPTISTDMLDRVEHRKQSYNNASFIARNPVLSMAKLQYYKLFAFLYGLMGRRSDVTMVNSTWTFNHIAQIWKNRDKTFIVYPPCDVEEFKKLPLFTHCRKTVRKIISIAQFRPEKDHMLQLDSFHKFIQDSGSSAYKLLLVGSCRNKGDEERVSQLQAHCKKLDIEKLVEFRLNVSFDELKRLMADSVIGIHTMWNEHFGIGVVELMAAGTVVLAHDSGGPKMDIVVEHNRQRTGFLANTVDSYAQAMYHIFSLSDCEILAIRNNARDSVSKFSDQEFENNFLRVMDIVISKK